MYERRVVLFVDILGFKDLIYKSRENADSIVQIIQVLNKLHDLCGKTGNEDEPEWGFEYDRQVSVFSDSIVISYREVGGAEYYLVREAMVIQIMLQYLGVYVRGGFTIGPLYHNGNTVIGPALIRAYELESKTAIYPRIVVESTTQDNWCMLAKDFDGICFIDYLGNASEWAYFLEHSENVTDDDCIFKIYSDTLIDKEFPNLKIKAKHDWMVRYVHESIKRKGNACELKRFNRSLYTR